MLMSIRLRIMSYCNTPRNEHEKSEMIDWARAEAFEDGTRDELWRVRCGPSVDYCVRFISGCAVLD